MKRRNLAFLLAVLMLLSVFLTACGDNKSTEAAETPTPTASETPIVTETPLPTETPAPTDSVILPEVSADPAETAAPAPTEYIDKLVFVGDANTYGLKYYKMLSGGSSTTQVWVPKSGTLAMDDLRGALIFYPETGEEISIAEAAALKQPEYIVLTVGMGGIATAEEKSFKSEYRSLIKSIQSASPDTVIICNSISPVEASYDAKENGITNTEIDIVNIWIAAVANETGTVYMDTASVLKGADGSLISEYGTGDGVHIGPAGYTAALNYLNEHQC